MTVPPLAGMRVLVTRASFLICVHANNGTGPRTLCNKGTTLAGPTSDKNDSEL
jgi:hypothetical protein